MKFDELVAARPQPPKTADEFWDLISNLIALEDISEDERTNFQAAFLTGASWMAAMAAEGRAKEGGEKLLQVHGEWAAKGVFG